MTPTQRSFLSCLSGAAMLVATVGGPADAAGLLASPGNTPGGGWGGGGGGGGHCHNVNIWKQININKPVTINKSIDINKSIVINKGGVSVSIAGAEASASSGAEIVYGGSYVGEMAVSHEVGEVGNFQAEETCETQQATVVKAIHTVCVAVTGEEFPASHMLGESWIESSYEGEVARCIAGSVLKVVIGDVVQSDQGMAGTYEHGRILMCRPHEVLRHFKDGMLKCAPATPVPDCTERTNLRRYGSGDFFFAYRAEVCAAPAHEVSVRDTNVTGMTLEGGVGD
ncbi:MAG TPA: hypothetical protein VHX61_13895 [Rhizomicrobium sp.]|jgi:hypothetical protein|nr:hypothetical protein [Rhizomicrobium sp.]